MFLLSLLWSLGLDPDWRACFDDKGEVEKREGGEKEEDDSDNTGVKDSRSTNSTNELQ